MCSSMYEYVRMVCWWYCVSLTTDREVRSDEEDEKKQQRRKDGPDLIDEVWTRVEKWRGVEEDQGCPYLSFYHLRS